MPRKSKLTPEQKKEAMARFQQWAATELPPPSAPLSSLPHAEKQKALREIEKRINKLYVHITRKEKCARRLLFDAIHYAREIGALLLRAKALVAHGEHEDWIIDNFLGGLSTARVYKRIAKNWRKIARRIKELGGMTIQQATDLLKERKLESKSAGRNNLSPLLKGIQQRLQFWPRSVVERLANDKELLVAAIEAAYQRAEHEIKQEKQAREARWSQAEVALTTVDERLIVEELMPQDFSDHNCERCTDVVM